MNDFDSYAYEVMGRWPKIALLVAEAKSNRPLQDAIMDALYKDDRTRLMGELERRGISEEEMRAFAEDVDPYLREPKLAVQSWYI
jgi:hypothetical protein